jgi:hypothetical protein
MRYAIGLLLAMSVACGGDSPVEPLNVQIAGTWHLQSINGSPLPFIVFQSATEKFEITSDVLTIVSSGTFTELTAFRLTENGAITNESFPDSGTFTINGNAITFVFISDATATGTGTLSDGTLTVTSSGVVLIYTK